MIKSRFGYTLLLYALLPRILLHPLVRARRQRAYLEHLRERFGYYRLAPAKPVIWLHAVSVGETRAAEPLVRALAREHPDHQILLTHMTPTGRDTGEALFGDEVLRCYLPYDFPAAVRRFLDHFRPRVGILMETEIWFNLIHEAAQRRIPVYLANARLSEKSFARYRRFSDLTSECLNELAAIAAQSAEDARRLTTLGARDVHVTGNLKFDIAPPAEQLELGRAWRRQYGESRPVLLAASMREGEEELLLDALHGLDVASLLLVIVPRHPQRFEEVAALLKRRGIAFQRRSENREIVPDTRIILGDSMGEMFAYYAACDLAFIGGSLLPYGAQNLIEACAVGKPVIIGPSVYNFAEATRLAVEQGAAIQVRDARELAREAARVLRDNALSEKMSQAALAFSRMHQGATERIMALLRF
ncbi:MAG: lipid IV(A) 3-deoxy-D-manno-octulosonic acid transferase [Betaproteobacteria bacterium]|nr:lipid IV(A) 3-deoxy-D-manno-octulosonic acid transferase [Betaproteobacteria bacterium]